MCFVPLEANGAKFFGFSEFLAALALLILVWTVADVRYRFRVRTAPIPLNVLTFVMIVAIGVLTLLTDLWRAEQWLVPTGNLITPAGWQAFLGALFLATFMAWVWFAFIRPPVFNRWNAHRYGSVVYGAIIRGSTADLPVIADEVGLSAKTLISHSWQAYEVKAFKDADDEGKKKLSSRWLRVRRYAYDTLLMIADRKFCRHVVQSCPNTALAIFEEVASSKKYDVPLEVFAKNITAEAIANKDSFIYQEVEGYHTGYVGFHKPLTQALYGNYEMVEAIGHVFDVDYREQLRWDAEQWEAFSRIVLMTFRGYIEGGYANNHSFVLFRSIHEIQRSIGGLYKLNGSATEWWGEESVKRLKVVVDFAKDAVELLNKHEGPIYYELRRREKSVQRDIHDLIAELMFETIFQASAVKSPRDVCWSIQHNDVWGEFFDSYTLDGKAGKVILFKLRRLLYDAVYEMTDFPNFKSSRLLGLMLNVMGLVEHNMHRGKGTKALHRAVLNWTRKNYAYMAHESPRVAADCLVEGIAYESEGPRLVKTGIQILDREPSRTVLGLDKRPNPLLAKLSTAAQASPEASGQAPSPAISRSDQAP